MAEWLSMFAAAKQLLSLGEQAEGRVTFFRKASPNELPQLELGCLRASHSRASPEPYDHPRRHHRLVRRVRACSRKLPWRRRFPPE